MRSILILFIAVLSMASSAAAQRATPATGGGPTIGAANGVTYTVISSTEIIKPDGVLCGYNRFMMPNPGLFRREVRRYQEFDSGILKRTWTETVDVFLRRHGP